MNAPAPQPMVAPPWVAMLQAHADQAETRLAEAGHRAPHLPAIAALTFNADRTAETALQLSQHGRRRRADVSPGALARDITNSAVEDQLGPRPARHRKDS